MNFRLTPILSKLLIVPVRLYQYVISPFTPAACRHLPTCSEYAIKAIKLHGPLKGSRLAMNRIGRCQPWGTSGFDPVPQVLIKKIKLNKYRPKMKIEAYNLLKSKIIVLLLVLTTLFSSCTNNLTDQQGKNHNMQVLVSIAPYKYFVDRISGNTVDAMVVIPPGTSPHAYDPTPRQLVEIDKTDIFFTNGLLTFEQALLERMKDNHSTIQIIDLSKGIKIIEGEGTHVCDHEHDHIHHSHNHNNFGADPHTWVSVENARIIAHQIFHTLTETYPSKAEVFKTNYELFNQEIDELDNKIAQLLSQIPGRSFMIFHPALGYFARDYNLNQLSIEFDGKEPSPQQLMHSIALARKENIKAILIQKEFDKENANIIAKEIGGKVIQIDPLSGNWAEEMNNIAKAINESWQ
jgi:zinc transport system substrate-binding protein